MFQEGGAMIGREREVVVVVGVPIRLVVHLYKEQRIIIDLFMDRQNRWRPIEMRQAGRLYISAQILANVEGFNKNKWRANSSSSSERRRWRLRSAFVCPPPLEALSH